MSAAQQSIGCVRGHHTNADAEMAGTMHNLHAVLCKCSNGKPPRIKQYTSGVVFFIFLCAATSLDSFVWWNLLT